MKTAPAAVRMPQFGPDAKVADLPLLQNLNQKRMVNGTMRPRAL